MELLIAPAIGILAGVLSGLFGIGGGIVIVPMLVTFFGYTQQRAVGTSLASLLIPIGIAISTYKYATNPDKAGVSFYVAGAITVGLAVGAYGGASLGLRLSSETLARAFGVLLLLVGVKFILKPG